MKSNFLLKVTQLEKVVDEEGKENLKVTNSKWVKTKAREFEKSLYFDRAEGVEHIIKIVSEAPVEFQVNTIYILADGKRAWVYVIKED